MIMIDYISILNSLEAEIRNARRTVLGGSKYIDEAKCMDYIFTLRNSIPEDIKEAKLILQERERILEDAKKEADYIIQDAERQAQMITDESQIIERAEAEADDIVMSAERYVENMQRNASIGMDELLFDAEQSMLRVINLIRESRDELQQRGFTPDDNNGKK